MASFFEITEQARRDRTQKFEGSIQLNADQSKPYWPMRIVPPKNAPNILLMMTDDVGFAAPSTFGGVIPTPALDRVAANGLRYRKLPFHVVALAHGAALITGRNHHSVGFGVVSDGPPASLAMTASSAKTMRPLAASS